MSETLEVDGVEVACVSGSFPSSQALIEVKVAETALAVKDGATEIDIVMPVGKFLSGDYERCRRYQRDEVCMWRQADEGDSGDGLPEDRL